MNVTNSEGKKMFRFQSDLNISNLPPDAYESLAADLNKNSSWKNLAKYLIEELDFESDMIQKLENRAFSIKDSPANLLLAELSIKNCSVEILDTMLESCNLIQLLPVLRKQESAYITIQPDHGLEEPGHLEVGLCQTLELSCEARGIPPPSYQWYHDDVRLDKQTSEKLSISIEAVSQKGTYWCKICQQGEKGQLMVELLSKPVEVSIAPTPVALTKQPKEFAKVKLDGSLELSCEAIGYPEPRFKWFRDNNQLDSQTTNILRITNFSARDEGKYRCQVYNEISEKISETCTVTLELSPEKAIAKVALLIANENYENYAALKTPRNDAAKIAKILKNLAFHVICLYDLTLVQMRNAIKIFCESLVEGTYGFFYFAGHGFKMQENYMLSVDAPQDYLRKDAVCESQLLSMALKGDPALFITVLDMCQTFPSQEYNPKIHEEVPHVNEYKGQKNLRNLLQAYSTSSYRPSFERLNKDHGLYATHLCKFLNENLPVTKVFEQVGKSIDTWLEGAERKQIPMFATTITKPYRLTDAIIQNEVPASIVNLEKLISFPSKSIDINFNQSGISCKATISCYIKPYLNLIQVTLSELDEKWDINFYNSVPTKRNNLFLSSIKNGCWLHSPQSTEGPLVISLIQNGVHVGATLLNVNQFAPLLLNKLNVQ